MTASLPVPNEIDPEEPDGHESQRVVPITPAAPQTKKPRQPRKSKAKRPAASPGTQSGASADTAPTAPPAVPDPGPPPPLPSDLEVVASVAAGIVVPPKPPLPAVERPAEKHSEASAPATEAAEAEVPEAEAPEAEAPESEAPDSEAPDSEAPEAEAPESEVPEAEAPEAEVAEAEVAEAEVAEAEVAEAEVAEAEVAEAEGDSTPEAESAASAGSQAPAQAAAEASAPVVTPEPPALPDTHPDEATPSPAAPDSAVVTPEHAVAPAPQPQPLPQGAPVPPPAPGTAGDALVLRGVTKRFGSTHAVEGIDLTVPAGTFYGLVGPNGAGKTTTLSMIAGLLEPDRGTIRVGGIDPAAKPLAAKKLMGVLPDRLRTFDRLTGRQLLYYYGVLRKLPPAVVESRTADLARAFDLEDALGRSVSDYSAGMLKKVMLAGALIHSPRLLVLDEPFEAVDPVSSAVILDILSTYVAHGGTVILSSHGMELVERVCSRVAVIVAGQVLAEGTVDEVRGELTLEQRFVELAGGLSDVEGLEWLHTFSD